MGLFSKVKKAVTSVADKAFNPASWLSTAKDVAGSSLGKLGIEGLGTYLGYPGLGSALAGYLGGSGDLTSVLAGGINDYSAQQLGKRTREQELEDYQRAYNDSLALADRQSASAMDMAQWGNIWEKQNAAQAQEWSQWNMAYANQLNQASADKQMAWQEGMANTAHQREVSDLRAAGLNPILSGTGGMGASSSGGASASVGTPSGPKANAPTPQVTQLGNIVTSAFGAMKAMADATNTNANTNYLQTAQTAKTKADTELSQSAKVVNETRARLNKDQSLKIASEIENIKAVRDNIPKTGRLTEAQTAQVQQSTRNLKQVFRDLKVKGDISEQDQAYWNNLLDQSGSSARGTVQMLNSLRQLLK